MLNKDYLRIITDLSKIIELQQRELFCSEITIERLKESLNEAQKGKDAI